jgi:hypothetical protein
MADGLPKSFTIWCCPNCWHTSLHPPGEPVCPNCSSDRYQRVETIARARLAEVEDAGEALRRFLTAWLLEALDLPAGVLNEYEPVADWQALVLRDRDRENTG